MTQKTTPQSEIEQPTSSGPIRRPSHWTPSDWAAALGLSLTVAGIVSGSYLALRGEVQNLNSNQSLTNQRVGAIEKRNDISDAITEKRGAQIEMLLQQAASNRALLERIVSELDRRK